MSEFEEKLNAILSDPGALEQIMGIAQSLGGKVDTAKAPSGSAPPSDPESGTEQASSAAPLPGADAFSFLDGMDPQMIRTILALFSQYNAEDDRRAALLTALRPFLKQERQDKIDRAMRIARLTRVAKAALEMFKGGDEPV